MDELLANPTRLVVLCCMGGLVLGSFATLLGLLRGDQRFQDQAGKWGSAFSGGQTGRKRQASDLDELRRAVSQLDAPDKPAGSAGKQDGPDAG